MCYRLGKMPWGERIDPGPAKQLTMCFLYLSTTAGINGPPMCLNLSTCLGAGKVTFSASVCAVQIQFPLKKKALDECEPCFCRPLCMYSTHTALSGSPCISEALHAHYISPEAGPHESCERFQPK